MLVALVALIPLNGWVMYKRATYRAEEARLREGMSALQREQADAALASNEHRYRIMVELIRRQARVDKDLHLAISVDSGVMHLERDGAVLRTIRMEVGPERTVGTPPDTVLLSAPRGTRVIERILESDEPWEIPNWVFADRGVQAPPDRAMRGALGSGAVLLNGGTAIYSMPSVGPLNDSGYVLPGSLRIPRGDLRTLMPNLKPGMTVYIY
jgi:hypothetical protein